MDIDIPTETGEPTNVKLIHRWTIKKYAHLYYGDNHPSFVQSKPFPLKDTENWTEKIQFFLRFFLYGINEKENKNFISMYLHMLDGPDVAVQCKLSMLDCMNEVVATSVKTFKGILTKHSDLGLSEYFSNTKESVFVNRLIMDDLVIICEIEFSIPAPSSSSSSFSPNKLIDTNNESYASVNVIKHEHPWTIPRFKQVFEDDMSINSDYISHESLENINLILRLWPKGKDKTEAKSHLSLFIYLTDCERQHVKACSRLSIRDVEKVSRHSKWIYGQLDGGNGFGCDRFIASDDLFKRDRELLPENNLNIFCEIQVTKEQAIQINQAQAEILQSSQNNPNYYVIKNCNATNCVINFDSQSTFGNLNLKNISKKRKH